MNPKRTSRFTAAFKAEVALAALTERHPLAELAMRYQLSVAQISRCKTQLCQQAVGSSTTRYGRSTRQRPGACGKVANYLSFQRNFRAMTVITDISQLDPNQSYTYADYLGWRSTEYVELIKGRILRKMSAPTPAHQEVVTNLVIEIGRYLKNKSCRVYAALPDVRLLHSTSNGDAQIKTVVQPDVCVVCDLTKIDRRGCLGAPDWIVEVVSPNSLVFDTKTKFDLYAENGVGEYWIVFPGEQTIIAYALNMAGEYKLTGTYAEPGRMASHTLPELVVDWLDIFEELP